MSWTKPAPRVRQWGGDRLPSPRLAAVRVAEPRSMACVPIPKASPVRSESYRRWIASHDCIDCGIGGWSQCAHENAGKARGAKVCDLRTFPLCAPRFGLMGCHFQFDNYIERTRDECRALGAVWVERMQALARADGLREFA